MTLEDEIIEAQSYAENPPKNESNTCEWIILPLLWAAGYARRDIESRMADSAGQYPDYTLLREIVSATWYLEAKAWNIALEDIHAKQALNYANQNGKRFVVLTNGQVWRLYDNRIEGLLAEKQIAHAALQDTLQITHFLTALSKTYVQSGGLKRFAAEINERKLREAEELQEQQRREAEAQRVQQRQQELHSLLYNTLPTQLTDPASEVVLLLTTFLKEKATFSEITPETIALLFDKILSLPADVKKGEAIASPPAPTIPLSLPEHPVERTLTLQALQSMAVDGKSSRPSVLHTPDGAQMAVRSWVDLAEKAVLWLLQQRTPLPVPFESGNRTRWFLNTSPVHKHTGSRCKFGPIAANGRTIYMDKDRSGADFLRAIHALCLETQLSPTAFRITML